MSDDESTSCPTLGARPSRSHCGAETRCALPIGCGRMDVAHIQYQRREAEARLSPKCDRGTFRGRSRVELLFSSLAGDMLPHLPMYPHLYNAARLLEARPTSPHISRHLTTSPDISPYLGSLCCLGSLGFISGDYRCMGDGPSHTTLG